jgi:LysR family transcriptional regulator, flagellar master operon regulator
LNNEINRMILSKQTIEVFVMDVSLARTFLAVVETGSFLNAGERVHVTQSTVSARIKNLEDQLGKVLFERSKSGAKLTPAGQQFLRHAQAMVRVWEHARLEISLPDGYDSALTVGGQYSLWAGFLIDWTSAMRISYPQIAIRAKFGFSDSLMKELIDGTLDLAVMYTPQARAGFEVDLLFEDELVLVTSDPAGTVLPANNYVMIDWGPEFRSDHALNYPDISIPGTYLELGALSVEYLLKAGGSGYMPKRLIDPLLKQDLLSIVEEAPAFTYPAYAVYASDMDEDWVRPIIKELNNTARAMKLVGV